MTISAQEAKTELILSSGSPFMSFNFRCDDPADLKVFRDGGVFTAWTCTSYGPTGGIILFNEPTVEEHIFTVIRDVDIKQEVNFDPHGSFPAQSTENALDRQTMSIQQQQVHIDRALKLPFGINQMDAEMPIPVGYKFLRWSSGGNRILNSAYGETDIETIITTAGTEAAAAAASAAAAAASAADADDSEAAAEASEAAALASENKAHDWAEETPGVEVEPGEYSAQHWATQAEAAANNLIAQRYTGLSAEGQTVITPGFSMSPVNRNAIVFLDGVRQVVDVDFTVGASTITLAEAIPAGVRMVVESTASTAGDAPPYAEEAGDIDIVYSPDNYEPDAGEIKDIDQHLAGLDRQMGVAAGFKNYVINGDFRIAQRGDSWPSVTTPTYTLDRWEANNSGAVMSVDRVNSSAAVLALNSEARHYIKLETSGTPNADWRLRHHIEDVWTLAGKPVTLSYLVRGSAGLDLTVNVTQDFGWAGDADVAVYSRTDTCDDDWHRVSHTFTVPSVFGATIGEKSHLLLEWRVADAVIGAFRLADVQLEAGTVATPFERLCLAQQMALCQRFFIKMSQPENTCLTIASAGAGSSYYQGVAFPTPMASIPSVGVQNVAETGSGFNGIGTASITIDSEAPDGFRFSVVATGTTTSRSNVWLEWTAEAEF